MFAIASHLLVQLVEKRNSKAIPFENIIVYNKWGKRFFPLVLSIDEPELHLHPYLQRAVLAFLQSILNNEEPFFKKLIQRTLGVDGLDGQLFVVTHSTDSLVNDYRQIIRLYWNEEKKVQVSCGTTFHFSREIEKHLIMHFPEVKEALYSRCTILVEGETEYGSFPYFAKTLGINFDYYGICLINARGESSITKISQLIRRFHIPTVCLYDKDVMVENPKPYVFYTDYICYEMDVVQKRWFSSFTEFIDHKDQIRCYPVQDGESLARYLVQEVQIFGEVHPDLLNHIDYASIGRELETSENYLFTDNGIFYYR